MVYRAIRVIADSTPGSVLGSADETQDVGAANASHVTGLRAAIHSLRASFPMSFFCFRVNPV